MYTLTVDINSFKRVILFQSAIIVKKIIENNWKQHSNYVFKTKFSVIITAFYRSIFKCQTVITYLYCNTVPKSNLCCFKFSQPVNKTQNISINLDTLCVFGVCGSKQER